MKRSDSDQWATGVMEFGEFTWSVSGMPEFHLTTTAPHSGVIGQLRKHLAAGEIVTHPTHIEFVARTEDDLQRIVVHLLGTGCRLRAHDVVRWLESVIRPSVISDPRVYKTLRDGLDAYKRRKWDSEWESKQKENPPK